jgi:general secretion pathway protein F
MALYRYKAVTQPGDLIEGVMEAASRSAVIEALRGQGLLPIRAEEHGRPRLGEWLNREVGRGRLSRADVTAIVRELATLLRAGLPLDQALEVMATFATKPAAGRLLQRVLERVRGGASLADALAAQGRMFDRFTIGMVRAGEAGGTLDTVLAKTAEFMERAEKTKQDLKSALIYPVILVITAMLSVAVIVTVVIPSFEDVFAQAGYELPLATRIVMGVGSLAQAFWWLPPLVLCLGLLVFTRLRASPDGRRAVDLNLLRLPFIGALMTKIEVGRFTYTLGMLLTNGVPMLAALAVARDTVGNAALAAALTDVTKDVKEGKTLAAPLERTGLFPRLATRLLRIGEESGRLEDMLFKVAETCEQDVLRGLQRGLTLLVPILTVVIALLIAGIIVSILIPMLSIHELVL